MKTLTIDTKLTFCPSCFRSIDAQTNLEDQVAPKPDDCTVCISCGAVLRFDAEMNLNLSSLEAIPMHSRLKFAKIVTAIKERGPLKDPYEWRVKT